VEEAQPSKTAFGVACHRAAHQTLDDPKIFEDPIALKIIGEETASRLALPPEQGGRASHPGLRAHMVTRSRFAEDTLAKSYEKGTRQYVLLGAGLDTFAYRNPYSDLRVFEVDHPATQAWKRELLERAAIKIPANVAFVPVNFEHDSLEAEMKRAGFDLHAQTFFAWLGVVPYLTESAFLETVGFIARMPQGSGVVFDYGLSRDKLSPMEEMMSDRLAARVAHAGEAFKLFFDPVELEAILMRTGFSHIEDLGREELNARYFANRTDGFQLMGRGRIVNAST
jgi:methyltransferase (TIGR00027 family)